MKPLRRFTRHIYLVVLMVLFCIVVPAALLYAAGWRYKEGFGFVRTGGIFVSIQYQGASVSLDGKPVGNSNFFNRNLYISDLAPSAYVVHVELEGHRPWDKVLVVEPSLVTDAQALLLPDETEPLKLVSGATATGTQSVSSSELSAIQAAFSEPFASSTTDLLEQDGRVVRVNNGDVSVEWDKEGQREPSIFCGRPSYCVQSIEVERGAQTALSAAFFGGGIVYATREGGIFFSEVDARPTVVFSRLYPRAGATFRIVDGKLIVKDGKNFYHIPL